MGTNDTNKSSGMLFLSIDGFVSDICPTVAHTHPFGNSGRFDVSGAEGSLYFFLGFASSHFFFLSARMRFRRSAPVSYFVWANLSLFESGQTRRSAPTFSFLHSSVSFPSTAALSTEAL